MAERAGFRLGDIEKLIKNTMGTGISRIKNALAAAGDPEPVFTFDSFFTVTFIRIPLPSQTTQETTQEQGKTTQETTQEKILSQIRKNPHITRKELAIELDITADGVKYHLNMLTKSHRIQHVGATKKGHWQITEKNK